MKKGCLWIGVCLLFLIGVGFLTQDFWSRQARIYIRGWVEVRAEETGRYLPEVDEVEILALGTRISPSIEAVESYPVLARKTVQGDESQAIAAAWRSLPRWDRVAGCHGPPYALRFRHKGKTLFETTICWHCGNYTMRFGFFDSAYYGFDARSKAAQELLRLLQAEVPGPIAAPHSNLDERAKAGDKPSSS